MELDRTNVRLLELLQKDARTTISELARTLNRAESTMRERVASLEKRGFITGYRAVVDPLKIGYRVHALIRADCDMRLIPELAKRLHAIPNVVRAHMTTGPKPLRIEVLADDLAQLEQMVEKRIAPLQLRDIEIGLVVQSLVENRQVPLRTEAGEATLPLPPRGEEAASPDAAPARPTSAFTPRF